jgi:hypothetical protein
LPIPTGERTAERINTSLIASLLGSILSHLREALKFTAMLSVTSSRIVFDRRLPFFSGHQQQELQKA